MISKKHLSLSVTLAALAANLWAFAPNEQGYIKVKNELDINIEILSGTERSFLGPHKIWSSCKSRCHLSGATIEIHPTVRARNHHRLRPRSFTFPIGKEGSYTVQYKRGAIQVLDQNNFSSMEF